MNHVDHFFGELYLHLEDQEAAPLGGGGGTSIDQHMESAQKLTLARREWFIAALRRDIEARGLAVGR